MLTPDTLAEGARLNMRRTRMSFHCTQCGESYAPEYANFECPRCGTIGQLADDGTSLLLESIEIET
jgi:hydrogenase nickel incorporation protein HypA/HybF